MDKHLSERIFAWGDSRRFHSYGQWFARTFGGRMQKISVEAGFTCPNRDGSKGWGGCTFCSNEAFHPAYCRPDIPIRQQISEGMEFHRKRYRRSKGYLVYFQSYSNTYKPVDVLNRLYREALSHPEVKGLVIGTRPDTVNEEVLALLVELQRNHFIMVEYGVESIYDTTLQQVNRGHSFADAVEAIQATHRAGIPCGAHFILGLPGETPEMLRQYAATISRLPLTTVKFHQLQLFKDTLMAARYIEKPDDFHLFTLEEYIDLLIYLIERLSPSIVIERVAGEVPPRFLVSPLWSRMRYDEVLRRIESEMKKRDTWQGRLYVP
ncbi:MAG TPA: TIGR01212 family radical SAM protein [Bacteroidales bacterium]|nr:TIGR01212 family radical SAM protein [Bacteroidales bacterium]